MSRAGAVIAYERAQEPARKLTAEALLKAGGDWRATFAEAGAMLHDQAEPAAGM